MFLLVIKDCFTNSTFYGYAANIHEFLNVPSIHFQLANKVMGLPVAFHTHIVFPSKSSPSPTAFSLILGGSHIKILDVRIHFELP